MSAQWLSHSSALSGRVGAAVTGALGAMAQPEHARRLRQILLCGLAVWAVLALTRLLWALLPGTAPEAAVPPAILNPVSISHSSTQAAPVDIDRMVAWHLFGQPGATPVVVAPPAAAAATANARAGIEDGAHATRLQLVLRGIVASTKDGLGYAVIESKNQQAVYTVDDKLPVPGKVVLAKVMPRQVVLDNGGTYELLVLFEDSTLGITANAAPAQAVPAAASEQIDKRDDPQATSVAQSYRQRLYENPQSLVDVASISPVREGSVLLGYRLSPGKEQEQFTQLGFKAGDVVTSVNGVSLDNPANTMVLYNTMRTANDVVFELQRGGQPLTLSVNLDGGANE